MDENETLFQVKKYYNIIIFLFSTGMFLLTYFHTNVIFWVFILLAHGGFVFNNETEANGKNTAITLG